MIVRDLSPNECKEMLERQRLGRLACAVDDKPYLVPIFYAYGDGCAYAFTMPGRKLDIMRANPCVSLLVEEKKSGREWTSVIAEGRFEELPDKIGHKQDRERAWTLLSKHANWWEPGSLRTVLTELTDHSRHVFFRIHIDKISGREAKEESEFL